MFAKAIVFASLNIFTFYVINEMLKVSHWVMKPFSLRTHFLQAIKPFSAALFCVGC